MKNISKRALLANTFGTFGYLFCLLLWGWVALLYVPLFLKNEYVEKFLLPPPSQEPIVAAPPTDMSSPLLVLALVITAIVIILTIFVLVKAPIALAHTGKAVTTKVAYSTAPLITKGRPLAPAKKKRLTANLIKVTKLALLILPIGLTLLGLFVRLPLEFIVVIVTSSTLAALGLIGFSLQYISAAALKVDAEALI